MTKALDAATLGLPERIEIDPERLLRAFTEDDASALFNAVDRARDVLRV